MVFLTYLILAVVILPLLTPGLLEYLLNSVLIGIVSSFDDVQPRLFVVLGGGGGLNRIFQPFRPSPHWCSGPPLSSPCSRTRREHHPVPTYARLAGKLLKLLYCIILPSRLNNLNPSYLFLSIIIVLCQRRKGVASCKLRRNKRSEVHFTRFATTTIHTTSTRKEASRERFSLLPSREVLCKA